MIAPRLPRDPQAGNSLLLALIVMSSLAALGSVTVVSVQSTLKASTHDRSQAIAMYAAESGAVAAMEFLRNRLPTINPAFVFPSSWATFTSKGLPEFPNPAFPSNGAQPNDTPGNPFSADQNAWYHVQVKDDPEGTDYRVIIESTGHGPQGSLAVIEWDVQWRRHSNPDPPNERLILRSWRIVL